MATPFLTDIDSRASIKGSRDPLGFVPLWSAFGRQVVGNLTTVSNSVRGFTTTLLGYYFAEVVRAGNGGERQAVLDVFLKFEQLAAYCRWHLAGDGDFRGIERTKLNLGERDRILLSAEPEHQILADQKVYGLWGLYSVPASASGLVDRDHLCLTDAARAFVEQQYIAELTRRGFKDGRPAIELLKGKESRLRLDDQHRALGKCLAAIHAADYTPAEKEFYRDHLVVNKALDTTGDRQAKLAALLAGLAPGEGFGISQLSRITRGARQRGDDWAPLAERLEQIGALERLLVPASSLFAFLLRNDRQTADRVAADVHRAWGARLTTVDSAAIEALKPEIAKAYADDAPASRLVAVASAFVSGDFGEALKLLLAHNQYVMTRRNAAPWVRLEAGRLVVRLDDESGDLAERAELREPWRNTYFINSLHRVQQSLEARRGH